MTEPSSDTPASHNPYHASKIYILRSPHTEKVYVGSTTTKLSERLIVHRSRHKRNIMQCTAKEVLDHGDAFIELVKEVHCENRAELAQEEAVILAQHPTAVNKNKPGRSRKQWLKDNKDRVRAYSKAYKAAKRAAKGLQPAATPKQDSPPAAPIESYFTSAAAEESPAPE